MKQVFRGYPQALAAAETGRKLMPYMVYKKDSQPPESGNAGRRKGTESEYLKGMYPLSVKRCQCLVEEACDRLEAADDFDLAVHDRPCQIERRKDLPEYRCEGFMVSGRVHT